MKDNKLIAEFIGRKGNNNPKLYTWKGITVLTDDIWYYISDAKFHSSWDWLMPVVEKIEDMKFGEGTTSVNVNFKQCTIEADGGLILISDIGGESKLIAVYEAVIKFIKWYNERQSSNN